jgi:hypothetical protein
MKRLQFQAVAGIFRLCGRRVGLLSHSCRRSTNAGE